MTTIYEDYDQEPEDVFLPLDEKRYTLFYHQEMSNFTEDISFYLDNIPAHSRILELGCGTGRLSKHMVAAGQRLCGIDLSPSMLRVAERCYDKSNANVQPYPPQFYKMDIRTFSFSHGFNAIIAPYNVLNLLLKREDIAACLSRIRKSLKDAGAGGRLLAEIFCIDEKYTIGEKSFQFQILEHPEGGRLIKEIIRRFNKDSIEVEERYRERPHSREFKDYSHSFSINAFTQSFWENILIEHGFSIKSISHSYPGSDKTAPGRTLFHAELAQ